MDTKMRWTTTDLLALAGVEGERYEIIDGELYVSKQPHWNHQAVSDQLVMQLGAWSKRSGLGKIRTAPGIIFDDDTNTAPDLVWVSQARLAAALEDDGKLHLAPELIIEILSRGSANEKRDRVVKLELYSRCGANEYWLVNWPTHQIEVYRRGSPEQALALAEILGEHDYLQSPLLPGFSCAVSEIFTDLI